MQHIRNFSIIAHIDHGKSTLADRFLEVTKTIEKRKMREQVLDSMELERERGITIKMQPVRMVYPVENVSNNKPQIPNKLKTQNDPSSKGLKFEVCDLEFSNSEYILNLIDTPGHIDFSYEVSRALSAVEGAVLLVDATQGVQAQTLTTLRSAQALGLVIVPAISKVDSPLADVAGVRGQVATLLAVSESEILLCSGKTGEGVGTVLEAVVERVPAPTKTSKSASPSLGESDLLRALVFDFQYSDHQGVIVYLRVFDGSIKKGAQLEFAASGRAFTALEVGVFAPAPTAAPELAAGSIGYVVTGIKEAGFARVGDTLRGKGSKTPALPGYAEPLPVVWAS